VAEHGSDAGDRLRRAARAAAPPRAAVPSDRKKKKEREKEKLSGGEGEGGIPLGLARVDYVHLYIGRRTRRARPYSLYPVANPTRDIRGADRHRGQK